MEREESYRERIDDLLIRRKGYRDTSFSATELAEKLGVSQFQLSRIIRSEYGMAYADIVHSYRIQDAMRLLRDKRYAPYAVDDIGSMVGFRNRQSFFNAFKKLTGSTPERFRREALR